VSLTYGTVGKGQTPLFRLVVDLLCNALYIACMLYNRSKLMECEHYGFHEYVQKPMDTMKSVLLKLACQDLHA